MTDQKKLIGSGDRREMDQALEKIGFARSRPAVAVPQAPVLAPPAPEFFNLKCMCAVRDKPYILHFVRRPGDLFRLVDRVKVEPGQQSGEQVRVANSSQITLDFREFERRYGPCPWCGHPGITECGCGWMVCQGRQIGELFRCRVSCGREFVGIPLEKLSGSQPCPEESASRAPHSAPTQHPQATKAPMPNKFLPTSTGIVVRNR
jgi:hypothetical protein